MSSASRRKRKVYGAVQNFDEDSLKQRNESDKDNVSDGDDDGDNRHSLDDSDTNDEEYYSVDLTTDENSKRGKTGTVSREKKIKIETDATKMPMKKDKGYNIIEKNKKKKQPLTKGIRRGDSEKGVATKFQDHDGNGEKTSTEQKKKEMANLDSFDVVLPSSILKGSGGSSDNQCTLLVEVSDLKDAIALGEFGGSIGAIGRFESDSKGITLDLKGNQYRGSLLPGPTCLVVGFPQSFGIKKKDSTTGTNNSQPIQEDEEVETGKLRVEGIVDEYATLVQIDDHMKKLDAIVTENHNDNNKGEIDFMGECE